MHQSPPNSPDQGPQQQYNPPPSMAYPQGQGYPPPQAYYGPPPGPPDEHGYGSDYGTWAAAFYGIRGFRTFRSCSTNIYLTSVIDRGCGVVYLSRDTIFRTTLCIVLLYTRGGYSHNVVVHQQPTVTNVVVSGSAQLGPNPATMTCPHCSAHITTTIHRQCGAYVWMMAGIICLIGLLVGVVLIGCCLIPFCIPSCYDAEHTCPNCGKFVGHFKRM